jgi:predicted transcriptional regulator
MGPSIFMASRGHRPQVLLFLAAVIVPSLVLVVLSLRMISQERELTEKRLLDEQHRRISEIRHELLTHLERIKLRQIRILETQTNAISADDGDPELVLVGSDENYRLHLQFQRGVSIRISAIGARTAQLAPSGGFACDGQDRIPRSPK